MVLYNRKYVSCSVLQCTCRYVLKSKVKIVTKLKELHDTCLGQVDIYTYSFDNEY